MVCLFDTERGPMAVVLVGAMIDRPPSNPSGPAWLRRRSAN
ncbi:hypothetical protein ACHWUR_29275 [Klebsiella pneumoniae]